MPSSRSRSPVLGFWALALATLVLLAELPSPSHAARKHDGGDDSTSSPEDALVQVSSSSSTPAVVSMKVLKYVADSYLVFRKVRDEYEGHAERIKLVNGMVNMHKASVNSLVSAVHGDFSATSEAEGIKQVLQGDDFLQFTALYDSFKKAKKLCVDDELLSESPTNMALRNAHPMSEEQKTKFSQSQAVITDFLASLKQVMDNEVCPKLQVAIEGELLNAQSKVEEWEDKTRVVGKAWGWYEMANTAYAGRENWETNIFKKCWKAAIGWATAKVQKDEKAGQASAYEKAFQVVSEKAREKLRSWQWKDGELEECHGGLAPEAGELQAKGVDDFEVVVDGDDPAAIQTIESLYNSSEAIEEAMDRASMMIEQYDTVCTGGKLGLKSALLSRGKEGGEAAKTAKKVLRPLKCDLCLRIGCRDLSIREKLDLAADIYSVAILGPEMKLAALASALLPKWAQDMVEHGAHFTNLSPSDDDHRVEQVLAWANFLFLEHEQGQARKNCIAMGDALTTVANTAAQMPKEGQAHPQHTQHSGDAGVDPDPEPELEGSTTESGAELKTAQAHEPEVRSSS